MIILHRYSSPYNTSLPLHPCFMLTLSMVFIKHPWPGHLISNIGQTGPACFEAATSVRYLRWNHCPWWEGWGAPQLCRLLQCYAAKCRPGWNCKWSCTCIIMLCCILCKVMSFKLNFNNTVRLDHF